MPDKPTWYSQLEAAIGQLEALPFPWVDRATIESTLGVGRRRAQQILQPLVRRSVGRNGLADREEVIRHLRRLAAGDAGHYEQQRRQRLAELLQTLQRERSTALMVEAPVAVVSQQLENLPEGVSVTPGRIEVSFGSTREALEKLLALAMAIRNDPLDFERMATGGR